MEFVVLAARLLFSVSLFLLGYDNITDARSKAEYAAQQGVVGAAVMVPLAGVLIVAGCVSIALGFYAQIGALLVLAFLLPVTVVMHAFWQIDDPKDRAMQRIQFFKNTPLIGGALLLVAFGSGALSITPDVVWP